VDRIGSGEKRKKARDVWMASMCNVSLAGNSGRASNLSRIIGDWTRGAVS
jgi:hypothetical protein